MPLVAPPIPAAAQRAIAGAVQSFLASLRPLPGTADPEQPYELAAPQAVYLLSARQLANTQPLSVARRGGWRFLVLQGRRAVAAVDLDAAKSGRPAAVSHISAGPYVEWTARAIRFAQLQPAVKRHDFEVRIVKVPSIYVYALWLHSAERDLLIPFAHSSVRLARGQRRSKTPLRVFDPTTCFALLRSLAAAGKPFDNSPRSDAKVAKSGPAAKSARNASRWPRIVPPPSRRAASAGPADGSPAKRAPPYGIS